jgi:ABC-type iron transport system FetAB permease component
MLKTLDTLMARLLFVSPAAQRTTTATAEVDQPPPAAERAFNLSLAISGVRCIIQYMILPFVLPVIGLAANWAVPISLAINLIAVAAIFFSLRRFWQTNYKGKWQYLGIALVALIFIVVFIYTDLTKIF